MHINAVSGHDYKNQTAKQQPSFKMLKTDHSARSLIKTLSDADKLEFNNICKRLSKTKYWDLHLSTVGSKKHKNFTFKFVNKKNPDMVINDNITPYRQENNQIFIYTLNSGINSNMSTIDILTYKTNEIAQNLYAEYQKQTNINFIKHWLLTPLENLLDRESKLNMLEKASDFKVFINNQKVINTTAETKPNVKHL